MNTRARSRRLASPVRLAMCPELGGPLDGAWWPHSSSVARELHELTDALFDRLGRIQEISVNWASFPKSLDIDTVTPMRGADPGRMYGRQRLMTVTGKTAPATLLVIPSCTSYALAVMVLRRAADIPTTHAEQNTQEFETAEQIVNAARAESARCAQRLREQNSLA